MPFQILSYLVPFVFIFDSIKTGAVFLIFWHFQEFDNFESNTKYGLYVNLLITHIKFIE